MKKQFQNGCPRVTVIFGQVNGVWVRGVAICSKGDIPCKKDGRKEALAYFRRAAGLKVNSVPMCRDEVKTIVKDIFYAPGNKELIFPFSQSAFFGWHCQYDTKPNTIEQGIMDKRMKEAEAA